MSTLRRTINPQVRVIDEDQGIVDYIASDESIDSYDEVIRADGWRFNRFTRNAPFIDSHSMESIGKVLGRVIDFRVSGGKLVERVKWAVDVPENEIAQLGFRMTVAGYLRAVSVGFYPVRYVSKWGNEVDDFRKELGRLQLEPTQAERVRVIYLEQEQIELSACVVGANPNALAKACREGKISKRELSLCLDYREAHAESLARSLSIKDECSTIASAIRRRALHKLTH